jgi:tripartite-type tricarboxylate transporter receptor subunit TctC
LRTPDTAAYLLNAGAEPVGLPPDQLAVKLRNEIARWAKVVKATNMKVD